MDKIGVFFYRTYRAYLIGRQNLLARRLVDLLTCDVVILP